MIIFASSVAEKLALKAKNQIKADPQEQSNLQPI